MTNTEHHDPEISGISPTKPQIESRPLLPEIRKSGADNPEYTHEVSEVAKTLHYEGPENRSLYELAMRLSGGRYMEDINRQVIVAAHDHGLISDQFHDAQLGIFRTIGDNAPDWSPQIMDQPLWQRVVTEAEAMPTIWGDPDLLWSDIANLYGFGVTTTFSSSKQANISENKQNVGSDPRLALYSAPVYANEDSFGNPASSGREYDDKGIGAGADWDKPKPESQAAV